MASGFTPEELLEAVPQRPPFRFLDEILEVDEEHVVAAVRFREDADFYRGHFPGHPITPGVILIEAMAQAGVVALGLYLLSLEGARHEIEKYVTVFTDCQVEFEGSVLPGERVVTTARKEFFRRRKLRARVEMAKEDGTPVASGVLAGMGVPR